MTREADGQKPYIDEQITVLGCMVTGALEQLTNLRPTRVMIYSPIVSPEQPLHTDPQLHGSN
jgi:hypothetical protein